MSDLDGRSSDQVLDQVEDLRNDLEQLRNQTAARSQTLPPDLGMKFLLDEFAELGEFWRHADSRVESALNLYLTGSTIIVSAVVLLATSVTQKTVLIGAAVFVAVGLALAGIVLAKRVIEAEIIKAEYIYALDLIRSYFVENADEITPYLILPLAHSPPLTEDGLASVLYKSPSQILLKGINLWVGLLLGFAAGGVLWVLMPDVSLVLPIGAGVLVLLLSPAYLNHTLKQEMQSRTAVVEARYRRPAKHSARRAM